MLSVVCPYCLAAKKDNAVINMFFSLAADVRVWLPTFSFFFNSSRPCSTSICVTEYLNQYYHNPCSLSDPFHFSRSPQSFLTACQWLVTASEESRVVWARDQQLYAAFQRAIPRIRTILLPVSTLAFGCSHQILSCIESISFSSPLPKSLSCTKAAAIRKLSEFPSLLSSPNPSPWTKVFHATVKYPYLSARSRPAPIQAEMYRSSYLGSLAPFFIPGTP